MVGKKKNEGRVVKMYRSEVYIFPELSLDIFLVIKLFSYKLTDIFISF